MGSPVIFQGSLAKFLVPNLNLDDQAYVLTGTVDPSSVATDAPQGSIYLRVGGSGGSAYLKQDNGSSTNWTIVTGANPTTAPSTQIFLSGSGTYTTPANVLYVRVRGVGGGGGGGGSGTGTSAGAGGDGTATTFDTLVANGGGGGNIGFNATPDSPAVASLGGYTQGVAISGQVGGPGGAISNGVLFVAGCNGGGTYFGGGAAAGGQLSPPADAAANTGGGGASTGASNNLEITGCGGGSGAMFDVIIPAPSATYAYAIGTGGTAGSAGTSGLAGSQGGSGIIVVDEFYQ